jgi:hypothetical protein
MSTWKRRKISFLYYFVLYYKTNIKLFSVLIYSYINTRGNWENLKLCENTLPFGRRVSTQFLVFPISTCVDITVYQHGKCFIFVNYNIAFVNSERWLAKSRVDITQCQHGNVRKFLSLYFFVLYYKTNIKHFFVLIYSYIDTGGNWENSRLCENIPHNFSFSQFPLVLI